MGVLGEPRKSFEDSSVEKISGVFLVGLPSKMGTHVVGLSMTMGSTGETVTPLTLRTLQRQFDICRSLNARRSWKTFSNTLKQI